MNYRPISACRIFGVLLVAFVGGASACSSADSGADGSLAADSGVADSVDAEGQGSTSQDSGSGVDGEPRDLDATQIDSTASEICDNELDDDGDGLVDCLDPECGGTDSCAAKPTCGPGDSDGDGLVDCFDPDCAGTPACFESDCHDQIDNDGDGLADCFDIDCLPQCRRPIPECEDGVDHDGDGLIGDAEPDCPRPIYPGCGDYYTCAVEEGCGCTSSVDCPSSAGPLQQCATNCLANQTCAQVCYEELPAQFQTALDGLDACTEAHCTAADFPAEATQCEWSTCAAEYAACYFNGPQSECSYYLECAQFCAINDSNCRAACESRLDASAGLDMLSFELCRHEVCDEDGDSMMDSPTCAHVATYLACGGAETAGTCAGWGTEGGASCMDYVNCWTSCDSLDHHACINACIANASPEAFSESAATGACLLAQCGTTDFGLSLGCFVDALAVECASAFESCTDGNGSPLSGP